MSDRIAELLRQKQLLQDHLNWLDREIARAASSAAGHEIAPTLSAPAATPAATPPPPAESPAKPVVEPSTPVIAPAQSAAAAPVATPKSAEAMRMADEIIARYQQEDALRPEDTKRGCMVLAAAIFALMGLAFLISWWFFYRSHQ